MKKEIWFGLIMLAAVVVAVLAFMPPPSEMTNGHLGLLMLALVVVAIMLGFPTAFTLMGMGVLFAWLAFHSRDPAVAWQQTLDLMVQRAYSVMSNDVLISIPLFIFMGYLVERANLIERLFKSLHIAMARVPAALAVATIVTCAVFATATGIVGAVVTLMGLLALPSMLKAGYSTQLAAGAITAGGCLGILIPPSVLLIVYGATAGVSVVKLYAGAFLPGIMLAALYVGYVIVLAKIKPSLAPPLPEEERHLALPALSQQLMAGGAQRSALAGLAGALRSTGVPRGAVLGQMGIVLLPVLAFVLLMGVSYRIVTAPVQTAAEAGAIEIGAATANTPADSSGLAEPPPADGLAEPPVSPAAGASNDLAAPPTAASGTPAAGAAPSPGGRAESALPGAPANAAADAPTVTPADKIAAKGDRRAAPNTFWITLGIGALLLLAFYATFNFHRVEIFKMMLGSLFPLAILILAVLGSIVFGLATPTEAAALGAFGGMLLAAAYRRFNLAMLKESAFLAVKTSAMVCWLFVGSSIFSAAFALLGGQEVINAWVLSMDLTPLQFMILAQTIIFLLGWPLEWTEIIVIFMPIFIPLLPHFNVDPLFFGLLVALNLQTAFLSPPVAMAAFYLKGVAPPHVTLNQIFLGMMPFMGIQVLALILLYIFPDIGLWLPRVLYQ
jgi:TRAP-type mannitol/chloroaromatic compound transport system permease large subunit